MFRNALSVLIIDNNLIPSFTMRESDLVVKDTEEIHAMDPYVEDHSIYFTNFEIHIVLFLHGVFSYFSKSKPSLTTLQGTYEIYLMTPEGICNPGLDAYANSEESIIYWEGNITYKKDSIQVMLEYVELDQSAVSSAMISSTYTKVIDNIIEVREPVVHKKTKIRLCMVQFQRNMMM